ncbi:MAG: cobalt-precorrin-6A reductase [Hyphomicrobiaceae bacterium]|nr:cobalt-precorrin-6A reductase [Hyphomicrobiaceae bacterium]
MKVLVFGGTIEAVEIANALVERGHAVTTSVAGRSAEPAKPKGKLVTGGLGGAEGIAEFIVRNHFEHVVDATHPFAPGIGAQILEAVSRSGVPLVRYARPPFTEPANSHWWRVESAAQAAERIPVGARVFLTLGRDSLEAFIRRRDVQFALRAIEMPDTSLPDNFDVVLATPPFSRSDELALMRKDRITHLVAKDSGGAMTGTKLEAAFMINVQVIMVDRPRLPNAPSVGSVTEVLAAFDRLPAPARTGLRRLFPV